MPAETDGGLEALHRLKSIDPPIYLTGSPELSKTGRLASQYLFSSLNPFAPKSPFTHLLTQGFVADQIWQQIDIQSQPLISSLRRQVRNFEKNPLEIEKKFNLDKRSEKKQDNVRKGTGNKASEDVESERKDFDADDDEEEKDGYENENDNDNGNDNDDDDGDGDMENEEISNVNGVEDMFLKINELEEYLEEDEAREYGLKKEKKGNKRKRVELMDADEDEDEEDEEVDGEEDADGGDDEELELLELADDDDDENKMENARYMRTFLVVKELVRRKVLHTMVLYRVRIWVMKIAKFFSVYVHVQERKRSLRIIDVLILFRCSAEETKSSTHEKEQDNLHAQIENMEKANLEPKTWTMQGEITASKRPKNSALEVDLDFEHNLRPAPVITEEFTASLEEMIQKRVLEKPPDLLHKAPREKRELDENKSTKGLAEVYEDEYAQKTGLVSAALSFSDERKKEVIEDMSIQVNVPALAMEEIAPLAVSDAAMLAPEEVFAGKGDIKVETELTKADRKRRRANKKRRFKARSAKQMTIKAQQSTSVNRDDGNEDK